MMTNQTKIMKGGLATLILTGLGYMTYSPALVPVMTFPIAASAFAISAAYVGLAYTAYLAAQFIYNLLKGSMNSDLAPIKPQDTPSVTTTPSPSEGLTNNPAINLQIPTPPASPPQTPPASPAQTPPTSPSQATPQPSSIVNVTINNNYLISLGRNIAASRPDQSPQPTRFQPSFSPDDVLDDDEVPLVRNQNNSSPNQSPEPMGFQQSFSPDESRSSVLNGGRSGSNDSQDVGMSDDGSVSMSSNPQTPPPFIPPIPVGSPPNSPVPNQGPQALIFQGPNSPRQVQSSPEERPPVRTSPRENKGVPPERYSPSPGRLNA